MSTLAERWKDPEFREHHRARMRRLNQDPAFLARNPKRNWTCPAGYEAVYVKLRDNLGAAKARVEIDRIAKAEMSA